MTTVGGSKIIYQRGNDLAITQNDPHFSSSANPSSVSGHFCGNVPYLAGTTRAVHIQQQTTMVIVTMSLLQAVANLKMKPTFIVPLLYALAATAFIFGATPASQSTESEGPNPHPAQAPEAAMTPQRFEFVSAGNRLSGFVDTPAGGAAKALIVIIPGYGETDVAGRTSYFDLRSYFTHLGITTVIWDKPGCGQSTGRFDADQPVASSAAEVLDAIRQLRTRSTSGAHKIGLWGLSRGGWIAPLAITQDPEIAFWISVSGTDAEENFPYLLESNLCIEGRTEQEISQLVGEWKRGFAITTRGGSFADYLAATRNLRRDPFFVYLSGGKEADEASFQTAKAQFLSGTFQLDSETGLQIYVPHFSETLTRVNLPVLAIFGEKDRNVDWRKTKALYERTIGENRGASLCVRNFPDGNHNLQQASNGGIREMLEMKERRMCSGYFEAMEAWLRTNVLN